MNIKIITLFLQIFLLFGNNIYSQIDINSKYEDTKSEKLLGLKEKNTLGYGTLNAFDVSSDGSFLVSAGGSGSIYIWDTETLEVVNILSGYFDEILSIAISPNQELVACGTDAGIIRIWNIKNKEVTKTIYAHKWEVVSLDFNSESKNLVSCSQDKTVKVWDVKTGINLNTFTFEDWVYSVAYGPDPNTIVSVNTHICPETFEIHIIKELNSNNIKKINILTNPTQKVAFTPDGNNIIAVGIVRKDRNYSIGIWGTANGDLVDTLYGSQYNLWSLGISPDGKYFATGGTDNNTGSIDLWDFTSKKLLYSIKDFRFSPKQLEFSADSKKLYSIGEKWNDISIYDVESGNLLSSFIGHTSNVYSIAFSPDGKKMFCGYRDGLAILWDIDSGESLYKYVGHTNSVQFVGCFPDGSKLASSGNDANLRIWDSKSEKLLGEIKVYPTSMAISPDGNIVACGHRSGATILCDPNSFISYDYKRIGNQPITAIAFSDDGRYLASASYKILIWDLYTNQIVDSITTDNVANLDALVFTKDNKNLIIGESKLLIWNIQTKGFVDSISILGGPYEMEFNADGSILALGYFDKIIFLDYDKKEIIKTAYSDGATIAYSKDFRRFANAGSDGVCRIWSIDEIMDVNDEKNNLINYSEFSIYPNPTTNKINIQYQIESSATVNIYLIDILGNKTPLKSEYKIPGEYNETFNLSAIPQGIYNIVLQTNNRINSDRIVILK